MEERVDRFLIMIINNCFYKSIWFSLLLLPLANIGLFFLSYSKSNNITNFHTIDLFEQIGICLIVAVAEEFFFRGFLLKEMVFRYNLRPIFASVIVSMLFGTMHLLNVNSYASWGYAVVQSICAFAVSINLAAIFIKYKSLLWCIAIHALINITSIGLYKNYNMEKLTLTSVEVGVFLVISMLYFIVGIPLLKEK